ncbi:DUF4159 domain-containing protein [bacterium]
MAPICADKRNVFTFTKLEYDGTWNPYKEDWQEIKNFFKRAVNIRCKEQVTVVKLDSKELFLNPFLVIIGDKSLPKFSTSEKENLLHFLNGGGILFINDTSISRNSLFDASIRTLFKEILTNNRLEVIPDTHAVYKSFYLIRIVSGRRLIFPYLEGIFIDGNLRVIYSRNDLLGVWIKDALGNYLYDCFPGGYEQRKEAFKLTVNILVYTVTGTYKEDVIHKPFIERKTYDLFK